MRKYKVLFVDDEEDIIIGIMNAVKNLLSLKHGYDISYSVLKNRKDIENMNEIAADIVLFDCALGAAALDFGNNDERTFGIELMRRFRKNNDRTKIIFYSGRFSMKGSQCYDFTHEEILSLINELHIYKMIPKRAENIADAILEAINELDAIIVSLEDLKEEYDSAGEFFVDNKLYPIGDLIEELKRGTIVGEDFRKSILKMVLTYMMKFGGDEE